MVRDVPGKAVAPTLEKMTTIAVIISQYLKNDLR